jgi:hypothetical protein
MCLGNTLIMLELIISIMSCYLHSQAYVIVAHLVHAISMHLSFKEECHSMTNLLCVGQIICIDSNFL